MFVWRAISNGVPFFERQSAKITLAAPKRIGRAVSVTLHRMVPYRTKACCLEINVAGFSGINLT